MTPSGSGSPAGVVRQVRSRRWRSCSGSIRRSSPTPRAVANLCEFSFEKKYFVPGFPRPAEGVPERERPARDPRDQGTQARYGDPLPAQRQGATRLRTGGDQPGGLRRLLPDRPGLHPRRARSRDPGGPGPRFRRRLAGRLRTRHHQRRSAPVRPAVRAVPESRAGLDAGHRRRLLLRAPGRGDRVRPPALRQEQRRPDHHLRHAQGPRRGQGRRPAAADPAR